MNGIAFAELFTVMVCHKMYIRVSLLSKTVALCVCSNLEHNQLRCVSADATGSSNDLEIL